MEEDVIILKKVSLTSDQMDALRLTMRKRRKVRVGNMLEKFTTDTVIEYRKAIEKANGGLT